MADFTTERAVTALDLRYTYVNAITSLGLQMAKIPIHFQNDREAIETAMASLASQHPERLRIVRIKDTLNLERVLVSECCSDEMTKRPEVRISGEARTMQFDEAGNLTGF